MVIYSIRNLINNKIYIGKTINDRDDYFGSGLLINRAIEKYGKENFSKEILEEVFSVETLNDREKYWIDEYNSTDLRIGYNIGKGGDGGDLFTNHPDKEEIRKKCSHPGESNGMFGRKHTDDTRRKMCENSVDKNKGYTPWNKGLKLKEYSEKYIALYERMKDPRINPRSKEFIFISPEGIEFNVFGGYDEFCSQHDLDTYSSRHFINMGKIPPPRKGNLKENRKNLTGWEIKRS